MCGFSPMHVGCREVILPQCMPQFVPLRLRKHFDCTPVGGRGGGFGGSPRPKLSGGRGEGFGSVTRGPPTTQYSSTLPLKCVLNPDIGEETFSVLLIEASPPTSPNRCEEPFAVTMQYLAVQCRGSLLKIGLASLVHAAMHIDELAVAMQLSCVARAGKIGQGTYGNVYKAADPHNSNEKVFLPPELASCDGQPSPHTSRIGAFIGGNRQQVRC